MKRIFIMLLSLLIMAGCRSASGEDGVMADYINIGERQYLNAWELALIDPAKIVKIGEVEDGSRLKKGSTVYEIEGYPNREVVAVREQGSSRGMPDYAMGFSIYVWYEGSGQSSHHPDITESIVNQIQIYRGTQLIRELKEESVEAFLELANQQSSDSESSDGGVVFDQGPEYTLLYFIDGALGLNYKVLEQEGAFYWAHAESKLPSEMAHYFQDTEKK